MARRLDCCWDLCDCFQSSSLAAQHPRAGLVKPTAITAKTSPEAIKPPGAGQRKQPMAWTTDGTADGDAAAAEADDVAGAAEMKRGLAAASTAAANKKPKGMVWVI